MDPLSKCRLGKSNVEVTVLGLGGAPLVGLKTPVPAAQARAAIEAAYAAGVRLFDTSPFYGIGLSEHRMGSVLCEKGVRDFVVSTEVGRYLVSRSAGEGRSSVLHRHAQHAARARLFL
jgi:D-threo-aldose 1-dehydrogenase